MDHPRDRASARSGAQHQGGHGYSRERRALAGNIAKALSGIHAAQIIHRDLKPSNVLISPDGPRVIDFGVAQAAEASTITGTGKITGSAAYMSPEQATSQKISPSSDIFSLGCLLYFAATGESAFGAGNPTAMLYRVVHAEPDLSALEDPAMRALVAACLIKNAEHRSSAHLITEVSTNQRPTSDLPVTPPAADDSAAAATVINAAALPPRASKRRRHVVSSAIAVGALALGIPGYLLMSQEPETTQPISLPGPTSTSPLSPTSTPTSSASATPSVTSSFNQRTNPDVPAEVTPAAVVADDAPEAPALEPSEPDAGGNGGGDSGGGNGGDTDDAAEQPAEDSEPEKKEPAKPREVAAPSAASSASASLDVPGAPTARVYFGELSSVMDSLSGSVSFEASSAFADSHTETCSLTVVFREVSGTTAAVYAQGFGAGWGGAENAPSQDVSTDDGVVHMQLVIPPAGSDPGDAWAGSAMLRADGQNTNSSGLNLSRGSDNTWKLNGQAVSCSV